MIGKKFAGEVFENFETVKPAFFSRFSLHLIAAL
jgi:hypothetical protein